MIIIQLKRAMRAYKRQHGEKVTYDTLSAATGIGAGTLSAIQSRENYNTTIDTLGRICRALKTTPYDILVFDPSKPQSVARKAGGRKKTKKTKTASKQAKKPKTKKKKAPKS